jgi:hypothetical protein
VRSFYSFPESVLEYEEVDLFDWNEEAKDIVFQMEFVRMVEDTDMSFSYNPVLLKAMLKNCCNEKGRSLVEESIDFFIGYYDKRKRDGLVVEKKSSIYYRDVFDRKFVKKNIFDNPFYRFESMEFMDKCKEIEDL